MKLQGIFPALVTPFDENGSVAPDKIRYNIGKLNRISLGGYLSCGSTAETPLLNTQERIEVLAAVAEAAAPERKLIAGLATENVREAVNVASRAAELGYHAALALTPYYYRAQMSRPETQLVYYRALADQSKLPVLIYNMPAVTGYDMPVEVIAQLSEHPNIIGMKDSSGNVEKLIATRSAARSEFQILSGSGLTFCDALSAGATGAILAIANAAPYACQLVWEALRIRQDDAARDWQQRILFGAKLVPSVHGIAGLKYAMDLNGYYGGYPRLPLLPLSPQARQEIETAFDGLKS